MMKNKHTLFHIVAVLAVAAVLPLLFSCADEDERAAVVDNSGIGSVVPEQVVAAAASLHAAPAATASAVPTTLNTAAKAAPAAVPAALVGADSRWSFVIGDDGLLSEIRRPDNRGQSSVYVTFGYESRDSIHNAVVTMTVDDGRDVGRTVCVFDIGRNGFANTCTESPADGGKALRWRFHYDADGHLVKVDDAGDVSILTYDDGGNLVRIRSLYDGGGTARLVYTGRPNSGYMPYRDASALNAAFGPILTLAYCAGLVGRPSKNLPAALTAENGFSVRSFVYTYRFDDAGFLKSISMKRTGRKNQ